jgi:uncharacterized protein (TIGR00106 family)
MLAELSIIPVGGSTHSSSELAKVLKLVDESGLPYQLTPSGTCIEGEWEEIMALIRHCHDRVRKSSSHVVTFIKLEEDDGERHKLTRNVTSVEEKIGHPLKTAKREPTNAEAPAPPWGKTSRRPSLRRGGTMTAQSKERSCTASFLRSENIWLVKSNARRLGRM